MNLTKQKIYDMKNELKTMSDEMSALIAAADFDPDGEAYKGLEQRMAKQKARIDAAEKQAAMEDMLGDNGGEKPDFSCADGAEKVFQSGVCKGLKEASVKRFADGVRKSLTEGTPASGGYTVPEDVVNRIYELIGSKDNMLPYITNTPVTTASGKRTYKTRKQMTGFATVAEAAKIAAMEEPTFAQISYVIEKRAGYLPVTEELLEDSDENIAAIVMTWIADEARVTINKKVVAKATAGEATAIKNLDDILGVLTTGLGSALRAISTIHTNDSGLLWLLTLKDGNNRPLLNPDPTQTTRMLLGVGPVTVPIKVWSDDTLPNTSGSAIPFVIGSLKEGIERFDRRDITITRLTEATVGSINLAEQDMVAFKATMRDDYQIRDAEAFKYCTLTQGAAG